MADELDEWIVLTLSQDDRLMEAAMPQGPVDGLQSANGEGPDHHSASSQAPSGERD